MSCVRGLLHFVRSVGGASRFIFWGCLAALLVSLALPVFAQDRPILTLETGHFGPVISVAFSPDGRTIASGSTDRTIILWDIEPGKMRQKLRGHTDFVTSVTFSPDGRIIASGSADRTIILWDTETGKMVRKLEGHTSTVFDVAFSPNGRTIASGGADFTVRLWDTATGKELAILISLDAGEDWLVVIPEGYYNASPNGDRYIRWQVGDELYPAEKYSKQFKRPDLVAKALRGEPLTGQ
jgi:WD40 repeat protein